MATYLFRCERDGLLEVIRPISADTRPGPCPRCGATTTRIFTTPHLATSQRSALALLDRTKRSASEPDVVTALPSRRSAPRRHAANPATARLPRP